MSPRRSLASVALLLLAGHVAVAGGMATRSLSLSAQAASSQVFVPIFHGPQLTPLQFLFVSSPREKKVVYTELRNFQSTTGRVFVLVDSGLVEPAGLSFDRVRGTLYIADRGANRIVRYRVTMKDAGDDGVTNRRSLVTDGVQLCIMQGHKVEWVSVDPATGDLFYSDLTSNTINKIEADVLEELGTGAYQCGDVRVVSAKVQMIEAQAKQREVMQMSAAEREARLPEDAPNTQATSLELYEGKVNPHLSVPGGVVSDGSRLYWTNKANGKEKGVAVVGQARPHLPADATVDAAGGTTSAFPTMALTNEVDAAYGIVRTNDMVLFSTNSTGSGAVYGVMDDGHAHNFVASLVEPRGLVWDGDSTVYVADQATSTVWSFPVGRLMDDAPLTRSAAVEGAFGVALLSLGDTPYSGAAAPGLREGTGWLLRWSAVIIFLLTAPITMFS